MAEELKEEEDIVGHALDSVKATTSKSRKRDKDSSTPAKRRCVSTACIACRRRKSKCDGNTPSCAACASVYGTECIYDPSSDNRRKGVYKKTIDSLRTRNSTLQTLIQAILNYSDDEVAGLVREIRNCESLDDVAESILTKGSEQQEQEDEVESPGTSVNSPIVPTFETELSGRMGELRLENGSLRFIGGTSNLIFLGSGAQDADLPKTPLALNEGQEPDQPMTSWTTVTQDSDLVAHLVTMYFTWHYTYFTTLSKSLFYRDFLFGKPSGDRQERRYCSSLLVNAILALGCHFTSVPGARADPSSPATAGDHFFREAKRLVLENDEHEKPKLTTVQALALMSVREAGCGREAKGWVYSGMSFRMAFDVGLNLDYGAVNSTKELSLDELEIDARRVTFWGCFLFDKCWSNYLGRQPQLPSSTVTVPKIDVFPDEDAATWYPYTDAGSIETHSQPSRTRAVALQISHLCEISSDLLISFYHPTHLEKSAGKSAELKKLSELHQRLETWRKELPKEMEPREGALPNVLLMHMFFQLLFIHLFRPLLRYNQATSPLPPHVSPRRLCTQAAASISKLLRLYRRTYGLRQICNIAVYIAHSACTIHLLNLPEKNAKRDIIYGVKHLEEIAEGWPCAGRTLSILSVLAQQWKVPLPADAAVVLARTSSAFSNYPREDSSSPKMIDTLSARSQIPPPYMGESDNPGNSPQATLPTSHSSTNAPSPGPSGLGHCTLQNTSSVGQLQSVFQPQQFPTLSSMSLPNANGQVSEAPEAMQTSPAALYGLSEIGQGSQDWWYKDQADIAAGFENWNGIGTDQGLGPGSHNTAFAHPDSQVFRLGNEWYG